MMEELPDEFMAQCEEDALRLRSEIELEVHAQLDPRILAADLGIDVVSIESFSEALPDEVRHLTEVDVSALQAATVFCGTRCLILVNPSQSDTEEALSICHELAHRDLEHEPTWPLFDDDGQRLWWSANEEAEAEQLAGALLVPASGVKPVLTRYEGDLRRAARHFGVSGTLMRRRVLDAGISIRVPSVEPSQFEQTSPSVLRRIPPGATGGDPAPASSPAG